MRWHFVHSNTSASHFACSCILVNAPMGIPFNHTLPSWAIIREAANGSLASCYALSLERSLAAVNCCRVVSQWMTDSPGSLRLDLPWTPILPSATVLKHHALLRQSFRLF